MQAQLTSLAIFTAYENYKNEIINPDNTKFDLETGRCLLGLRRRIHDDDGWTTGRIMYDLHARDGIRQLHRSIVSSVYSTSPIFPTCAFPFQDMVNITARTLPFKSHKGVTRYLVLELTRCSSKFPFEELQIIRDNDSTKASIETDIPDEDKLPCWPKPQETVADDKGNTKIQHNTDPQRHTVHVHLSLIGERFDYLRDKKIIKEQKESCTYKVGGVLLTKPLEIDDFSSGPEYSMTAPVGAVQVGYIKGRESLEPSYEIMVEAAEILNSLSEVNAGMRSASYDQFKIPLTKNRHKRQWPYLNFKQRALRCIWAIEIEYKNLWFCFIDSELRKKGEKSAALIMQDSGAAFTDTDFWRLLYSISRSEDLWDDPTFINRGFITYKRKHTWASAEQCTTAIYNMLLMLSGL